MTIHDGTGMGALWQTIIFVGGLIPAALAITGLLMWLHRRRAAFGSPTGRRPALASSAG